MNDTHVSDRDLLLAVDRELPRLRARAVETHLAACHVCRLRLAQVADVLAQVTPRDGVDPPTAATERALLAQRIAAQPQRTAWLPAWATARVAIAASVLLLAAIIGVTRFPTGGEAGVLLRPRPDLTPGATREVTVTEICGAARFRRQGGITNATHQRIFDRYGTDFADAEHYELDYLITPELGGSDAPSNLWPQPFSRTLWNAYVKDELERYMHEEVCAGRLALAAAQREISTDWIAAYKRHFSTDTPRRDYTASPLTPDDTELLLSELEERGVTPLSSHSSWKDGWY